MTNKYFQNRFASPILKTFSERSFTETVPPVRNSTSLQIVYLIIEEIETFLTTLKEQG